MEAKNETLWQGHHSCQTELTLIGMRSAALHGCSPHYGEAYLSDFCQEEYYREERVDLTGSEGSGWKYDRGTLAI
jgi:hypothetical protein